jgi:hypothetical protein
LRALHALADADVVFYDELVTPAVLDRARRDAEQVFVGKRRGEAGIGQDEINRPRPRAPVAAWCGSRAAIPSSSGAGAKSWSICARPAYRSSSFPE